ncbi:nitrilase-related carbon-nitrogen hydrolase [Nonomuraea africana]|uniref:Amidohydrolase n=1 Tax=Nonomuraea africana TaxID=46171 RepID=A0ABR9KDI1_9ACTN|nr:nitrilase-related carbon-nitrogen hydrolase [Nonomuraea africana]MBE1560072.1 putative amidohydrolase [Nonomuraea africana]
MAAQIQVSWTVEDNLQRIRDVLTQTQADDLVLLPEGALSGYGTDLSALDDRSRADAAGQAASYVADLARQHGVHVFCGSLIWEHSAWWNAALYFGPNAERWDYRKINLAMNERGRLRSGARLAPLSIATRAGTVTVGVQICREIRFPEQWRHLVDAGAEVLVYLTHAANPTEPSGVWRSHLISRAAENQRFVLACNAAEPLQHCPSMIVSPRGEVLAETVSTGPESLRTTIDVNQTSNWYLSQRRDVSNL